MATFEGRFSDASGLRIAVIVARFNDLVTAKLLSGCLDCLHRHGVDTSADSAQLDVAWVPGSFELPLVAQQLARSGRYQVVSTPKITGTPVSRATAAMPLLASATTTSK